MIAKESQEYINSLPKYGTDEYYARLHELEDRGFFENYNPNYWDQPFVEDQDDDDEWEDEEYERS